ncbi:hypothetical protein M407DRAFT_13956 [Tulasnella calospora MUT 4182]|uniref:Uncharacterized protein n=1 Tax=Tulasnella calospora MUT 4182 TaxID=1051891 RepID=A0A0C3QUM9_9AGAM|nr:hypothetical protein M407DRAFT_13956 [Tulasnella calospora MUT 4182]
MTNPATDAPRTLHKTISSHKGAVNVVRYAKGSAKYGLSGGRDRLIKLWNRETAMEIKTYTGHGYEVLCLDVAHDNSKFASCGGDRVAYVWDVTSGETIRRFHGHAGRINVVALNADSSVLATGSYDSTVRLWDLRSQSRQAIQTLDDARDSIMSLHVGPTEIITGSVDGYVRSYDIRKGELNSDLIGFPVSSIQPMDDSLSLLIGTLDSTIRLMDRANGTVLNTFKGHVNKDYSTKSCFGYGQASVICGDEEGRIWSWDLLTATPMGTQPPPKVHEKVITWVEHHPTASGDMLTASADGTVKVWRS